jgi:ribosomal protein L29
VSDWEEMTGFSEERSNKIKTLESRVRELEAELAECKGDPDSYDNTYKRNIELQRELTELRARHSALVVAASKCIPKPGIIAISIEESERIISELKAALAEVKKP